MIISLFVLTRVYSLVTNTKDRMTGLNITILWNIITENVFISINNNSNEEYGGLMSQLRAPALLVL